MENENCTKVCNNDKANLGCEQDSSCSWKMIGILTGKEIICHELIVSEDKEKQKASLKPTTYDLTLGEGHYVYSGDGVNKEKRWKLVFIGKKERMEELNKSGAEIEKYDWPEKKRTYLTIPAYGSALIQLRETIDTYSVAKDKKVLVVGRFDLKLGNVHKGLISQQATQVEPYYRGKLFCFIHNLSNRDIELKYGEKIATIEFSYVSCFCGEQKREEIIKDLENMNREKYGDNSYCEANGIAEIRYFRAQDKLPDDCGLLGLKDRILEEIKEDEIVEKLAKSDSFMEKLVQKIGKKLQK